MKLPVTAELPGLQLLLLVADGASQTFEQQTQCMRVQLPHPLTAPLNTTHAQSVCSCRRLGAGCVIWRQLILSCAAVATGALSEDRPPAIMPDSVHDCCLRPVAVR